MLRCTTANFQSVSKVLSDNCLYNSHMTDLTRILLIHSSRHSGRQNDLWPESEHRHGGRPKRRGMGQGVDAIDPCPPYSRRLGGGAPTVITPASSPGRAFARRLALTLVLSVLDYRARLTRNRVTWRHADKQRR